jgi:DNA (cytosine-5)-methyltransferase 1
MIDVNLFAGAGGLAVGLRSAGFSPLHLFEKDGEACATLRQNTLSKLPTIDGTIFEQDVKEVDWRQFRDRVRLLAAGAPCQPFSLGGKHLASEDGRNLFPELVRAVRCLRPAAVIVENVRGLLREGFKNYFTYILRQLEFPFLRPGPKELWKHHDSRIRRHQCSVGYAPGYQVSWRLLNAADFGVPQKRFRIFIVATRYDLPPYRFPSPTHSMAHLLHAQMNGEYWKRYGIEKKCLAENHGRVVTIPKEELFLKAWQTVRDAIIDLPPAGCSEKEASMNHWLIPGARTYPSHSGSTMDSPAKK